MPKLEELKDEYDLLCHAMQSGVKFVLDLDRDCAVSDAWDKNACGPKHLRTGVNSALVDNSALAKLLMDKRIITELEYYQALVDGMRAEVVRYETALSMQLGKKITLA